MDLGHLISPLEWHFFAVAEGKDAQLLAGTASHPQVGPICVLSAMRAKDEVMPIYLAMFLAICMVERGSS